MKTPRLRRRSRTTDTVPVQPARKPEHVPAQPDSRGTRTTEREFARIDRKALKRATKAERRRERKAPKPEKPAKISRTAQLRNRLERKLQEKAAEPAALTPDARAGLMGVSRRGALIAITVLDLLATAVSFGESWDALYQWATHHGLKGAWAVAFPLQIDTFIAMGELALFIAILDHWAPRNRLWAWISTFGGLALSMVGNVGHVHGHPGSWQATAAVPPLAAMAGMFIGFQVLKRVMSPTTAAIHDQETTELISQLRHQVEELSRRPEPKPEPVQVPQPRLESLPVVMGPNGEPSAYDATAWDPSGYLADVEKEGQQTPPTPRTSMGQDKPTIVREDVLEMLKGVAKPDPKPAPQTAPKRARKGGRHARWDEAVELYRKSGATKDERFSQRELAAALKMKNRQLAARVIDHVENGGE